MKKKSANTRPRSGISTLRHRKNPKGCLAWCVVRKDDERITFNNCVSLVNGRYVSLSRGERIIRVRITECEHSRNTRR